MPARLTLQHPPYRKTSAVKAAETRHSAPPCDIDPVSSFPPFLLPRYSNERSAEQVLEDSGTSVAPAERPQASDTKHMPPPPTILGAWVRHAEPLAKVVEKTPSSNESSEEGNEASANNEASNNEASSNEASTTDKASTNDKANANDKASANDEASGNDEASANEDAEDHNEDEGDQKGDEKCQGNDNKHDRADTDSTTLVVSDPFHKTGGDLPAVLSAPSIGEPTSLRPDGEGLFYYSLLLLSFTFDLVCTPPMKPVPDDGINLHFGIKTIFTFL